MKYNFANDYSEGCHPSIIETLSASNMIQQPGYGDDKYSLFTIARIRQMIEESDADVHLIAGGTLTNLVVLGAILKPFESVIAVETGHINTHEAGAIEATGHKVEIVHSADGKLSPENVRPLLDKYPIYHTVKPRVVYISNSTEAGTIYSKLELTDLSNFCRANNLLLFLDGARLSAALTAKTNDLSLPDIAELTDIFYIGGTKCGALLGEAVVIVNDTLKADFRYHMKQRGAMLAKGRVLGIQFFKLLEDNLIFDLARHANAMAAKLSIAIKDIGFSFLAESETNQIFPILPDKIIGSLNNIYEFHIWKKFGDGNSAVRLVTSWATPEKAVDDFITDIRRLAAEL